MDNPALGRRYDGQIAQVFALLEKIVMDGLRHGFFDCAIECEMVAGKKRNLVIRAGKFHKFIIADDELPR